MTGDFHPGQLLMVGIRGKTLDADQAAFLRRNRIRAGIANLQPGVIGYPRPQGNGKVAHTTVEQQLFLLFPNSDRFLEASAIPFAGR